MVHSLAGASCLGRILEQVPFPSAAEKGQASGAVGPGNPHKGLGARVPVTQLVLSKCIKESLM